MAFQHGRSSAVLMDKYDLSSYFRNTDIAKSVDTHETTTYGASAKSYTVGLKDGTLSLEGLWDGASGASDERLQAMLGTASGQVVTFAPAGLTVGNRCELLVSRLTSYNVSDPVADLVIVNVDCQADGGVDGGVVLHALTAETAAANGTTVDNSASTSNGYAANLHVTAFTGTTATIKVQHSTDGSTWADLATFTAATATTSEQKTGTGTVNRYVRYTISGTFTSVTFAVALARR